jgi:hypothetical protein
MQTLPARCNNNELGHRPDVDCVYTEVPGKISVLDTFASLVTEHTLNHHNEVLMDHNIFPYIIDLTDTLDSLPVKWAA